MRGKCTELWQSNTPKEISWRARSNSNDVAQRHSIRIYGSDSRETPAAQCMAHTDASQSAPQRIPTSGQQSSRAVDSSMGLLHASEYAVHYTSLAASDDDDTSAQVRGIRAATSSTQLPPSSLLKLRSSSYSNSKDALVDDHLKEKPPSANAIGKVARIGPHHIATPDGLLRSVGLNPFSFHVAADALALKAMSHNSYARRRWLHVNQISEQALGVADDRLELSKALYSNSSVLQQLEHQWTSLSEPAVLPLTTDPTSEHMQARCVHSRTTLRPVFDLPFCAWASH